MAMLLTPSPPDSRSPAGGVMFRRLWATTASSNLGDGIILAGLPVLAATLTRSPTLIAGVTVATMLPMVLTALPAGLLADRTDTRVVLVAGNLLRAVGLLLVLAGLWHPATRLWAVYGAALLAGSSEVLVDTAAQTALPGLVAPAGLPRANARIGGTQVLLNDAVGAPVGSLLAVQAAAWVFAGPALLYALAAGLATRLRVPARPPRARVDTVAEVREGFAVLRQHPVLGRLAMANGLSNLGNTAFFAVFVLYVVGDLGLPEAAYGWLVAALAGGGLLGSMLAERTQRRVGMRATLLGAMGTLVVIYLVLAALPVTAVAAVGMGLIGLGAMQWGVTSRVLRQTAAPIALLGRVTASMMLAALVATPLGGVLGGLVAELVGVRSVGILAAAANVLALLVMASAPRTAYPDQDRPAAPLGPRSLGRTRTSATADHAMARHARGDHQLLQQLR